MQTWESQRIRVRRKPERSAYDEATVFEIIDAALICHVGVVRDGWPAVLPTIHARIGSTVYLHGSPAAGALRDARKGSPVCLSFTLIDGLVLTRTARNHSMNYRSAVVYGTGTRVTDRAEKTAALEALTNRVIPGRWDEVVQPDEAGLRETEVIAVEIAEASAKRRTGVPEADDSAGASSAWAGVIPLVTSHGAPVRAPFVDPEALPPRW